MTWEDLEKVEAYLKENGYRKGVKYSNCRLSLHSSFSEVVYEGLFWSGV